MRIIDDVGRLYPELDLISLRILLTVYENPGYCIREVADILMLDRKLVQLKIALMAEGRGKNRPKASKRRLITIDRRLADRRKRDLALTEKGIELAEQLQPLVEEKTII